MNCPKCAHDNLSDRNFCGACGTSLARYCPRCGFRNGAADQFCGGCGVRFVASAARPTADQGAPATPDKEPPAPSPASDGVLDELLEAAREGAQEGFVAPDAKVSQADIDSLFGD